MWSGKRRLFYIFLDPSFKIFPEYFHYPLRLYGARKEEEDFEISQKLA